MSPAGIPLWSSRYPSTGSGSPAQLYRAVTAAQWAGYGGLNVALLQFTDQATIAGRNVDCSAFNGTRQELLTLLGNTSSVSWSDVEGAVLPTLKEGDGEKNGGARGRLHWWVLSVQALCNVRGLTQQTSQDGLFGPTTTAMVKELQHRSGITIDGVVGPITWQWLLGNDAPDYA